MDLLKRRKSERTKTILNSEEDQTEETFFTLQMNKIYKCK